MQNENIKKYLDFIKVEIDQFYKMRRIERAFNLSQVTNHHFNCAEFPHYFSGKLDSEIVLVHLNPKSRDSKSDYYKNAEFEYKSYEDYIDKYSRFGYYSYNRSAPNPWKKSTPFDKKQLQFLKPFRVINFNEETDDWFNLEKSMDEKLQLELIPYGSDDFDHTILTPEVLKPYFEQIIQVIQAYPRKYILFCGSVFHKLPYIKDSDLKENKFKLIKVDGSETQNPYKFYNLTLDYNGNKMKAGIAHSFAIQGLAGRLMYKYGEKCFNLFNEV